MYRRDEIQTTKLISEFIKMLCHNLRRYKGCNHFQQC